ncbi:MAG TPA: hypothetical protein VF476_04725 [Chitinophagaceae bacterium]
MIENEILEGLANEFGPIVTGKSYEDGRQALANRVNELLNADFDKLVSILYRMDVDENKLKGFIEKNPNTDAGLIIADLIIERQIQKIESRKNFPGNTEQNSEEEKW